MNARPIVNIEGAGEATAIELLAAWAFLGGALHAKLELLPNDKLLELRAVAVDVMAAATAERARRP